MTVLRVVVVVAGCVAGCLAPRVVDDRPGEGTAVQVATGGNDCGMSGCGNSNSPEIDYLGVHDLDMTGAQPNANGFRIASYSKDGTAYQPVVDRAALTGRDLVTGKIMLHDGGLVGSRFVVVNAKHGTEYLIEIYAVGSVAYWAKPDGLAMTTPTYLVNWSCRKRASRRPGRSGRTSAGSPPPTSTTPWE
jgi:hypothetical protein